MTKTISDTPRKKVTRWSKTDWTKSPPFAIRHPDDRRNGDSHAYLHERCLPRRQIDEKTARHSYLRLFHPVSTCPGLFQDIRPAANSLCHTWTQGVRRADPKIADNGFGAIKHEGKRLLNILPRMGHNRFRRGFCWSIPVEHLPRDKLSCRFWLRFARHALFRSVQQRHRREKPRNSKADGIRREKYAVDHDMVSTMKRSFRWDG